MVEGETLRTISPHLISEQMATRILFQIISMASFLQQKGICHNDLSLSNVMLDRPSQRLLLIDFADSCLISPKKEQHATSSTNPTSSSSTTSGTTEISTTSAIPTTLRFASSTKTALETPMTLASSDILESPPLFKQFPFVKAAAISAKIVALPRFQHLTVKENECKDDVKLERLVHNWVEKTQLSNGVHLLKKSLANCVKKKNLFKTLLTLPIFNGISYSDLIELRGNRRRHHH